MKGNESSYMWLRSSGGSSSSRHVVRVSRWVMVGVGARDGMCVGAVRCCRRHLADAVVSGRSEMIVSCMFVFCCCR